LKRAKFVVAHSAAKCRNQEFEHINSAAENATERVRSPSFYEEFLAERAEILRHKWIESEKAGYDIGFERALLDWVAKHRSAWRESRQRRLENGLGSQSGAAGQK